MLEVGAVAPDQEIQTHSGFKGQLSHFWKDGPLILFFYPKDNTSICTKEACLLQSQLPKFGEYQAGVLGSSTDSIASHKAFAEGNQIHFPLVADGGGHLARAYLAFRGLLRVSKRVTYVIGPHGLILGRVHHEFSVQPHLEMIQNTLDGVKG